MSKRLMKLARALQQKKHRVDENAFLVEGEKSALELMQSGKFNIRALLFSEKFYKKYADLCDKIADKSLISENDLSATGSFENNSDVIAIAEIPEKKTDFKGKNALSELVLVLDQIKDPGNLGTIIRLADWYALTQIICSLDCVDFFNPKTIAASMGSFLRVEAIYADLTTVLPEKKHSYGAFLGGKNIHTLSPEKNAFIVIGNESNGIRPETAKLIRHKITIPKFGGAESLNAAMATGIILDNFKRQISLKNGSE
jgi:TrmH family RNA methyltransferase